MKFQQPVWPNGDPMIGIEVGKDADNKPIFVVELEFDQPEEGKERDVSKLISQLKAFSKNLKDMPDSASMEFLGNFLLCLAFATKLTEPLGLEGDVMDDLDVALACVCLNDPELFKQAQGQLPPDGKLKTVMMQILKTLELI